MIQTDYLQPIFDISKLTKTVKRAVKLLRQFKRKRGFSALVFTGVSGSSLGFILSYCLKVPVIYLRKAKDSSHSYLQIEGYCREGKFNYVVVDDFIASGATVSKIVRDMQDYAKQAKCVGLYLYKDNRSYHEVNLKRKRITIPNLSHENSNKKY